MRRFLNLQIDIGYKCNLKCIMCLFSTGIESPKNSMTFDLFEKIGQKIFPEVRSVTFSGLGEPLLTEDFWQYVECCRRYDVPHVGFITNGTLLSGENIKHALSRADYIIVSIDGANKETFEGIRAGAGFERIISNIERLNYLRGDNKAAPSLAFLTVLMNRNIKELPGIVGLAGKMNAEKVICQHLIPFKGLNIEDESILKTCNKHKVNFSLNKASLLAREFGVELRTPYNCGSGTGGGIPFFL